MAGNVNINGQLNQIPEGSDTIGPLTIIPSSANKVTVTPVIWLHVVSHDYYSLG